MFAGTLANFMTATIAGSSCDALQEVQLQDCRKGRAQGLVSFPSALAAFLCNPDFLQSCND